MRKAATPGAIRKAVERRSGKERRVSGSVENEVRARIVQEAKARVTGHYSGYLSNGDEYSIDLTLTDFEMDMDMELEIIR